MICFVETRPLNTHFISILLLRAAESEKTLLPRNTLFPDSTPLFPDNTPLLPRNTLFHNGNPLLPSNTLFPDSTPLFSHNTCCYQQLMHVVPSMPFSFP